jgi:hypothetical protein
VRARTRALFSAADKETPVADLEYDSLVDHSDGVHSPTRTVRFGRKEGQATVVATNGSSGDLFDAEIHIVPEDAYTIRTQHADGQSLTAETTRAGCARISGVQIGLVTFYVFPRAPRAGWRTAWLRF